MYQTNSLDLYVQKIGIDGSDILDSQYASMDGKIEVTLPIEGILQEHRLKYPAATDVCI